MERVLLFEQALAEVLRHAEVLPSPAHTEAVALLSTQGRTLASPILAERDQPPFPRSTRDGFAVCSADLAAPAETDLRLLGSLRAGERWTGPPLQRGEAIEIMTGAPLPPGADAVLMVEHTEPTLEDHIRPERGRNLRKGENVVPTGAEARAGAELVAVGRRLATPEISLAASCGYALLPVYAKPVVAVVATGDELVELTEHPQDWQIRNSNGYALASLVQAEGATPLQLSAAQDTLEDLRDRLRQARTTDLILFSGGVSKGKYDLVERTLEEAGAEFFFTGALIQPGKPVVFGRLPRPEGASTYFFGLPGNPISTEVCFRLFVAPLLRALCGQTLRAPRFAEARLTGAIPGGSRVTRFLPAQVEGDWEGVSVRLVPWQGSGDLAANGRANGFAVLPREKAVFAAGETVRVLLR